jgi:hypothetical protein
MALNVEIPLKENWLAIRKKQLLAEKYVNHIETLDSIIQGLSSKYNGNFVYSAFFLYNSQFVKSRFLTLEENSPIFQLFKTFSSDFTINASFRKLDYWKNSSIDENILEVFNSFNLNKYPKGAKKLEYDDYILFALQDTQNINFNLKTLVSIVDWSFKNKKKIVFKLHPESKTDTKIHEIFKLLTDKYPVRYYKVVNNSYDIQNLIDNANAVWSFNSGVSLNSLLKGKSTVSFMNSDLNPVCRFCKTPEEAFSVKPTNEEELMRFLSWYYHRFTIDITSKNANDRIKELFDLFYNEKKSLKHILNMDWKS